MASDSDAKGKAKRGPHTLTDDELVARRNGWVSLLENNWGAVGWELKRARTANAIYEAFRPLASKSFDQTLQPFLRDSTERTGRAAFRRINKEYFAAALKESEIEKKLNDQRTLVQGARSAVFELSTKNRKHLKEQIGWRNENIREIAIRLSNERAETRKAELALKKTIEQDREALARQSNSQKFECDKIENELTTEKGIVRGLETRVAAITAVRRKAAATILGERNESLLSIERQALDARTTSANLWKRLLDQQAYFCRAELLEFIRPKKGKRKKYAHNARNLANGLAGLPVMTCGQSAKRCAKYPYKIAPGWTAQLFEFLDRTWRRADPRSRKSSLKLFQEAIARLPKTQIVRVDGKGRKIENDFRQHLEDNWPYLKPAIEYGVRESKHPNEVPYRIAAKFQENWSKPRTAADILFAERAKL